MNIKNSPTSRLPIKIGKTEFRHDGTTYEVVSEKDGKWGARVKWAYDAKDMEIKFFESDYVEANRCDAKFKRNELNHRLKEMGEGHVLHFKSIEGWIRGMIVVDDGTFKMKATALVGTWDMSAMPSIQPDGTKRKGSTAVENVLEGKSWQIKSADAFYELDPRFQGEGKVDPATLNEVVIATQDKSDRELIRLRSVHAKALKALLMGETAEYPAGSTKDVQGHGNALHGNVALGEHVMRIKRRGDVLHDKAALKAHLEWIRDLLAAIDDPESEVMGPKELQSIQHNMFVASMNMGLRGRLEG